MKISVVTAVFNSEDTVGEAISSAARQTYKNIEHLVIDGNSSDNSRFVIEENMHENLTLISEPDDGIYDALNKGIKRATGDVIGFLHSDDLFAHDNVLASIAEAFRDTSVEAVYGNLDYVSQTDTSKVIRRWSTGSFCGSKLRRGWMPAHPTLYLKREVYTQLGLFDTSFKIAADYDFILRYFSQAKPEKTALLDDVLYKMRVGGASNRSIANIIRKTREDLTSIQRNNVGSYLTLILKNTSKLGQFFVR